jgi:hypothetical protein
MFNKKQLLEELIGRVDEIVTEMEASEDSSFGFFDVALEYAQQLRDELESLSE